MKLSRRRCLHLVATAAALPAFSRCARAQAYPARPVRVLEGFGSGSSADLAARLIGHWLSERMGQHFVIDTEAVVRAAPDGYTLLTCVTANAINATLYEKLNFNFIRDIAPVAGLLRMSLVVLVNPSLAAKTLPEFIAYARANPGKVNIAVPGNGSGPHVAGELFKMMTEINIVNVPYRGPAPAFTDLISGQVQVMFVALPAAIGYIRAGELRALAVTGASRSSELPDVAAVAEFVQAYELDRDRCAQGHPRRNHRQAQQQYHCRTCRPAAQGSDQRSRRRSNADDAQPVWGAYGRRNREVGQSGEVRRHQAVVIR